MPNIVALETFMEQVVLLRIMAPTVEIVNQLVETMMHYGLSNGCKVKSGEHTGDKPMATLVFDCKDLKVAKNLRALYGHAAM